MDERLGGPDAATLAALREADPVIAALFLDECRAQGSFVMLLLAGPADGNLPGLDDLVGTSLTLAWRRLAAALGDGQ